MIVELPADVWAEVLGYISGDNELRRICSTSRVFRDVAKGRLYKELKVHLHWNKEDITDEYPRWPTSPPQVGPAIQSRMLELYSSPPVANHVRRCFLTSMCAVRGPAKKAYGPPGPLQDTVRKMFLDLHVPITFKNLTHLIVSRITVTRDVFIEIARVSSLVRLEISDCPLKTEPKAIEGGAYPQTLPPPLDTKLAIREFLVNQVDTLKWLNCLFAERLYAIYFLNTHAPVAITPLTAPTFQNVEYLDIPIDLGPILQNLQIIHRLPNLMRLHLRGSAGKQLTLPPLPVTRANLKVYDGPAKLFPFFISDQLESLTLRTAWTPGQSDLLDAMKILLPAVTPACNIACFRAVAVNINKDLFEAIGSTFKNLKALEISAAEYHHRTGKITTMTLNYTELDLPGAIKLLPESLEHLILEWVPPRCLLGNHRLGSPEALAAEQAFKNELLSARPGLKSAMVHATMPEDVLWLKEPMDVVDRFWPVEFYNLYCAGVCPQALFHFDHPMDRCRDCYLNTYDN